MTEFKLLTIDTFTTYCPHFAERETSVLRLQKIMRENNIRHLPVLDGDKVVGVLSSRDLEVFNNEHFAEKYTAEDIMIPEPYCVQSGESIRNVALTMANQKISSAIVLDKESRCKGIITSTDLLGALVEVLNESNRF